MDLELVDRAAHAVPGAQRARAGRHHACGSRRTTPTASRSASSTRTAPTSTKARSARSSGCCTARTSAARSRATSATSCSRPARWSSTPPRSKRSVDADRLRRRVVQGRARLLVRRGVDRDAERARQDRRDRARGQPVRDDRRCRRRRRGPRDARRRRSATSCARRAPTSGSCSTPTARPRRSSTTRAPRSTAEQALLALVSSSASHRPAPASRCRSSVSREAERIADAARRVDRVDEAVGRAPDGGRGQRRSRLRGVAGGRLHLARVPARVRRGRDARAPARPARRRRTVRCRRSLAEVPEPHVAHEARADAVGTQGRGDARRDGAGEGACRPCSSTA